MLVSSSSDLKFEAFHFCFYMTKNTCILFDVSVHNNEKPVHDVFLFSSLSVSCFFSCDYRLCCYFDCWLYTNTHVKNTRTYTTTYTASLLMFLSLSSHKGFSDFDISPEIYFYIYTIWCGHAEHTHSEMSNKSLVWMQRNVFI